MCVKELRLLKPSLGRQKFTQSKWGWLYYPLCLRAPWVREIFFFANEDIQCSLNWHFHSTAAPQERFVLPRLPLGVLLQGNYCFPKLIFYLDVGRQIIFYLFCLKAMWAFRKMARSLVVSLPLPANSPSRFRFLNIIISLQVKHRQ